MQALLAGELTSASALEQMTPTVQAHQTFWSGARYGLGLQSYPLSSGGTAWGHGGDFLPPAFIDPTDVPALMKTYHQVTAAVDSALSS